MTELERIAGALREAAQEGSSALLATVVACEGSTYRRVGARMLVTASGTLGAISGGCLEADVLERRERLEAAGVPERVSYDSRSRDELVWGLGLGCNGRLDVLLEPLAGASLDAVSACFSRAVAAQTAALATIVATDAPARFALGDRLLIDANGARIGGSLAPQQLGSRYETLLADAWQVLERGGWERCERELDGASVDVLWQRVVPAPRLTVCGGGADAIPLVGLAAQMGWRVQLLDHRSAFASAARFPSAETIIAASPVAVSEALAAAPPDAVVVMSHHFERDVAYLAAALASPAPYVGVLGPRARSERLLAELSARGRALDGALLARLYAPVGLDLGAETPEEIAFAIVSEVLAVWRGRAGAPLRERRGGIHEPPRAPARRGDADRIRGRILLSHPGSARET